MAKRLVNFCLATALAGCGGADPEPMTNPVWNYTADTGPGTWADLSADHALCGTRQQQSPLALANSAVIELDASHVSPLSHPEEIADLILAAAESAP